MSYNIELPKKENESIFMVGHVKCDKGKNLNYAGIYDKGCGQSKNACNNDKDKRSSPRGMKKDKNKRQKVMKAVRELRNLDVLDLEEEKKIMKTLECNEKCVHGKCKSCDTKWKRHVTNEIDRHVKEQCFQPVNTKEYPVINFEQEKGILN